MTDKELWLRRENESSKAFEGFLCYLLLGGNRSLSKVASEVGMSDSSVRLWSRTHDWVARAAAWDDYNARGVLDAASEAQRDQVQEAWSEASSWLARLLPGALQVIEDELRTGGRQSRQWASRQVLDRQSATAKRSVAEHVLADLSYGKRFVSQVFAILAKYVDEATLAQIQREVAALVKSEVPRA